MGDFTFERRSKNLSAASNWCVPNVFSDERKGSSKTGKKAEYHKLLGFSLSKLFDSTLYLQKEILC